MAYARKIPQGGSGMAPLRLTDGESVEKRLGDFGRMVKNEPLKLQQHFLEHPNKKTLGDVGAVSGGYTVPDDAGVEVIARLKERCLFHELAYQQPMASLTCSRGGFDLTAGHATGNSPLWGGMAPTWGVQNLPSGIPETDPSFMDQMLIAKNLQGIITCSNQLVDDGGEALGAYLMSGFVECTKWGVEQACFMGIGGNAPNGIANGPGTVVVSRQTTVTVTSQDLGGMLGSLLPASFVNAVWAVSVTAMAKIAQLSQFLVNAANPGDPLCGWLFSRPVYVTEHLPAVGTQGDVMLFDPTMYTLGFRDLSIDVSPHYKWANMQTVFRFVWRGDGGQRVQNPLKLQDNATTVGCYVALSTK